MVSSVIVLILCHAKFELLNATKGIRKPATPYTSQ